MELDARGRGSAPPMTVAGPSYRQDAVRYVADNLESCVDELLEAADADKREGLHDEVQDQLSDLLSELAASD